MRNKVFFVLFLLITAVRVFSQQEQSQQDWFKGKPIADIRFSGIKNASLPEIESLVFPYRGREYDENLYTEILTKLFALNFFVNIDVNTQRADGGNKVNLLFTVTEFPFVSRINFSGNSGVRRSELSDVITSKISNFHSPVKVRADIEAIKNKYTEKGYPDANVTVTETPSGDSSIVLTFVISEGNKITIKSIEFQGNTKFSNSTLRGQLSLKAKTLLKDGAFQEAKLLTDIEAINKYYQDRGYIDASVKDVTRTYDVDEKGTHMNLTFMIEEGNRYTFSGVTFEGNIIFSTPQLEKLIYSKKGDIINFSKVMSDLQRVSDLYYENGYIFNTIDRITIKDEQANTVSYKVSIVERGRAYIEDIIVVGNEKTKTNVILREIPLEPGDVFSKTKVMDAMRNLYNLQFFSTVMPDTQPGSSENLMVLVFNVEEQPTTDIQFGFTFSGSADPDSFPISGMVKWNDRNFLGTGNQVGAEVTSSIVDSTSVSTNYLHRWIMGLPLSGGVDLTLDYSRRFATMNNTAPFFNGDETYAFPDGFQSRGEYENNDKLPPKDYLMEFRQWYLSLGLSTGYRWNTFLGIFGINGGTRFGIIKNVYDNTLYRPFDPALRDRNNEWVPKNSFWFSTSLDQRDIFYDPSSGYLLFNRVGFHGILSVEREFYIRDDLKMQYYYTLLNLPVTEKWSFKVVFAVQAGLSTIFKQPWRTDMDPTVPIPMEDANKLSVDGMFVGRGWRESRVKGLLLVDNWVELRIPLVTGILAWDFFFDMAGVETTQGYYFARNNEGDRNFTLDNLRFSFGGGLRFTIPQFPFRLALAKRFKFVDGEFQWQPGDLFGDRDNPRKGVDLVISFVLSY